MPTPRSDVAARLVLIEEHLEAIEPLLLRIESALPIPSALSLVASRLNAIDSKLSLLVPPSEVRAAMAEATEHQEAAADSAPLQSQQLKEITDWIESRMTGDSSAGVADLAFIAQQLVSIMQGTRDDIVQMRATLRRLSGLLDASLREKVEGDLRWRPGDSERRKAG